MNLKNVTGLLAARFVHLQDSEVTEEERDFSMHLEQLLLTGLVIEPEHDLEFEDRWILNNDTSIEDKAIIDHFRKEVYDPAESDSEAGSSASQQSGGSTYMPSPEKIARFTPETSLEVMQKVVNYCKAVDGTWRIGRAQSRFRAAFKDCSTKPAVLNKLKRFQKYVDNHGSRLEKLKTIHNYVLNKFEEAKHNYKIVHDRDLRFWAYEINETVQLINFKASNFWLHQFKTINHIVSRKINRTVTPKFTREELDIRNRANQFIAGISNEKGEFYPAIYNTDQSGFQYEMHTGRTLEYKGTPIVTTVVQSEGATTHSYTIQPLIRIDGTLHPTLFICLQERSGIFPDNPRQAIIQKDNIYLKCSSSGKLNKELITCWFEDVFFPEIEKSSSKLAMLIHDAWPGFNSLGMREGLNIAMRQIPPKTTGIVQPLDVFFFRPWKVFATYISDHIVLMAIDISLQQRNNIIKLQSLIHYQFSAERYKHMIKYAWFKANYAVERDNVIFETPAAFCFNTLPSYECLDCLVGQGMKETVFARCSHCENYYCFNHFFKPSCPQDYHKCNG